MSSIPTTSALIVKATSFSGMQDKLAIGALLSLKLMALTAVITTIVSAIFLQFQMTAAGLLLSISSGLGVYYFKPVETITQATNAIELERAKFQKSFLDAKANNDKLSKEIIKLNELNKTLKSDAEIMLKKEIQERGLISKNLTAAQKQLQDLKPSIDRLNALPANVEDQLKTLQEENSKLKNLNTSLSQIEDKLKNSEVLFKNDRETFQSQIDEMKKANTQLQESIQSQKVEMEKVQSERAELLKKIQFFNEIQDQAKPILGNLLALTEEISSSDSSSSSSSPVTSGGMDAMIQHAAQLKKLQEAKNITGNNNK